EALVAAGRRVDAQYARARRIDRRVGTARDGCLTGVAATGQARLARPADEVVAVTPGDPGRRVAHRAAGERLDGEGLGQRRRRPHHYRGDQCARERERTNELLRSSAHEMLLPSRTCAPSLTRVEAARPEDLRALNLVSRPASDGDQ